MPEETRGVAPRLRSWIEDTFFVDGFDDTTSFLKNRLIDSTGMMELVVFIESEFGFKADDAELVPDNLDSIDNLVRYIARKKAPRETVVRPVISRRGEGGVGRAEGG
ncbi:MAG: acyl carrier protein [Archangium sp.]|nr:acyl carrier protein [Archangium sp.]MDP3153790.1 acyl carrier protein [Archangium sp.]MDP3569377.1 acyl carrier protein [Archangium sp.]